MGAAVIGVVNMKKFNHGFAAMASYLWKINLITHLTEPLLDVEEKTPMMIKYVAFAWIDQSFMGPMFETNSTIAGFTFFRIIEDHEYLVVHFVFPSHKHWRDQNINKLSLFIDMDLNSLAYMCLLFIITIFIINPQL